jgi:citrate synthase
MRTPVVEASPSETLAAAAHRMHDSAVGCVVVTDSTQRPIGILSERDLLKAVGAGADPARAKISEWMTADPDTVAPETPASDALRALIKRGYRHLPVVEHERLAGILSLRDLMRIAEIRSVETPAADVPRGLKGVAVAETTIGDVRGDESFFHYREHNALDLARTRSLEDVWHLIHRGRLPSGIERGGFVAETAALRGIDERVGAVLPTIAREAGATLAGLRLAHSMLAAAEGFAPTLDISESVLETQAMRTAAVFPTLVAALWRLSKGEQPIAPDPSLGQAENYLYMLTGEQPDPRCVRALERYLILTIDHGFNTSTFAARIVASTRADLGSSIAAALGALSGPLHGGSPSRALDLLDEIGTINRAESVIREHLERGERLMGFGHAVYRTEDPRSRMLRDMAEELGGPRIELAIGVERVALWLLREMRGRELYANVEFYASVVLERVGLPRELFTPTFATSRVIGWTAHVLEQTRDNRIIRPSARYVGPSVGTRARAP